ncbi:MAG: DUF309 domain-containing protein [Verrucomicrobiota bacterium]
MNKSERIAAFVEKQGDLSPLPLNPYYLGFFKCFNRQDYYEAHDVLEQLWLKTPGADHLFFKGLIQLAGAFVHLKKQYQSPLHRVDGKRLGPAMRLFKLASKNLQGYRPHHLHCDVDALCNLCATLASEIEQSGLSRNPWNPEHAPQINPIC